eukprot:36826-Prymnesium_polylepis.1
MAVSEEQALQLLQQTQLKSAYFKDFDFQQLIDLSHNLSIIEFKKGDTVFSQGEPATFYAVLLQGTLKPVAGGQQVGTNRVVGELLGEMALFEGGTRTASLIADADGYLAAFQFAQLEQLKGSNPSLAKKMNVQLASAALGKKYEARGVSLTSLSESDLATEIDILLKQQAAQQWEKASQLAGEESLLRRGASRVPSRPSASRPPSSGRPTSGAGSRDTLVETAEREPIGWARLPSEASFNERVELLGTLQATVQSAAGDAPSWLGSLSADALRDLAMAAAVVSYAVGEALFTANEASMCAGLLLSGSVGEVRGGQLVVKLAGSFVGEDPFFTGVPRRATCVGIEDGTVVRAQRINAHGHVAHVAHVHVHAARHTCTCRAHGM